MFLKFIVIVIYDVNQSNTVAPLSLISKLLSDCRVIYILVGIFAAEIVPFAPDFYCEHVARFCI